jgi:hypothetical protein
LSAGQPAGCVGEEIMAVELVSQAELWLDHDVEDGRLTANAKEQAAVELSSLFELFGDSDVLAMFEMQEPSDAAVARTTAQSRWLGIADQRLQNWLVPFGDVTPTGYLTDGGDRSAGVNGITLSTRA